MKVKFVLSERLSGFSKTSSQAFPFNILFILGISSAIMPLPIAPEMVSDIGLMTVITIIGAIFAYSKNEVDKKEGAVLVALFILYMAFVIIRN